VDPVASLDAVGTVLACVSDSKLTSSTVELVSVDVVHENLGIGNAHHHPMQTLAVGTDSVSVRLRQVPVMPAQLLKSIGVD
jgi:hypothetical protein